MYSIALKSQWKWFIGVSSQFMVHSLYINLKNIFKWFMVSSLKSSAIPLLLEKKQKTELCLL